MQQTHYQKQSYLIKKVLPVLLENSDEIMNNKEYFFSEDANVFYLNIAFFGGGPLSLGVLLKIWQQNLLSKNNQSCDKCNHNLFLINASGSILSGSHCVTAVCPSCKEIQHLKNIENFGKLAITIKRLIQSYPNETIIQAGKKPKFSWGQGLVGETTPDKILKEKVFGKKLIQVLWELADPITKAQLEEMQSELPSLKNKIDSKKDFGIAKLKGRDIGFFKDLF